MPATFLPRLVNDRFEDPGLFVPFRLEKRAIIFDLGNIDALAPKDILKITHCFVTHAHMDHFTGFDTLLRLMLGREKNLCLFGPTGFLAHIEGKLAGYEWNLVDNFTYDFCIEATEVGSDSLLTRQYRCKDQFQATAENRSDTFTGVLLDEPPFSVSAVILDHGIDCLGFKLEERFHVNIKKTAIQEMGLDVGPWIKDFKTALYEEKPMDTMVATGDGTRKTYRLGDLAQNIAHITPGQTITYIADAACSRENVNRIVDFAGLSDHLYIEAGFLDAERDVALEKRHLTARCAGEIAGRAGARNVTLFHFSPRYQGREDQLEQEAMDAYLTELSNRHANGKRMV